MGRGAMNEEKDAVGEQKRQFSKIQASSPPCRSVVGVACSKLSTSFDNFFPQYFPAKFTYRNSDQIYRNIYLSQLFVSTFGTFIATVYEFT